MNTFTPFPQSSIAQEIINKNLTNPQPKQNTGVFRNPQFDLRTEQGLPSDALYPNPQLDFSGDTPPTDPCPEGYMLVDGVCQPIEQFGQSMYDENAGGKGFEDERPYMSIDQMRNASDEELLDYLTSGFLKNSLLGYLPSKGSEVTMKGGMMPLYFQLPFGGQNEMRQNFIMTELMKRGYFTGNFDKNQNPIFDIANKNVNTNTGGIESALPQNTGGAVTDVFGDTYTRKNDGAGYTFTSGTPLPSVLQQTQGGVDYGTGRGGTSDNQMQRGNVVINNRPFGSEKVDDYEDDRSGI
nr:hypothetical protein [uncultured Mediterranean phage uvMED]